jgi:hypothetical protein
MLKLMLCELGIDVDVDAAVRLVSARSDWLVREHGLTPTAARLSLTDLHLLHVAAVIAGEHGLRGPTRKVSRSIDGPLIADTCVALIHVAKAKVPVDPTSALESLALAVNVVRGLRTTLAGDTCPSVAPYSYFASASYLQQAIADHVTDDCHPEVGEMIRKVAEQLDAALATPLRQA